MAAFNQVAGRHIAAEQRVILNQVAVTVEGCPVHHHGRNRRVALHDLQRRLVRFGAQQQQPIDALLHQRLKIAIHSLLVAFGVAQHQAVAALKTAAFYAAHQFRVERVGTGGDQHADGMGLIQLEATRQCRRRVVQRFDGRINFLGDRLADEPVFIDDVRYG